MNASSHLLFALLQASPLHQVDKLAAVLVANSNIAAARDEVDHLAVAQQGGVDQLLTKPELKRLLVHVLNGLQ